MGLKVRRKVRTTDRFRVIHAGDKNVEVNEISWEREQKKGADRQGGTPHLRGEGRYGTL